MPSPATQRPARQDNRRQALLDAAAALFAERGYRATSMRDLAAAVGMLPGSIYYHFPSKDELLVAVYAEGVTRIEARVRAALAGTRSAWERLELACAAHLESLLDGSAYAAVVVRVLPDDAPATRDALVALRDRHEALFRELVDALGLPGDAAARRALRLLLLGALNWVPLWYRPGGENPRAIAHRFIQLLIPGEPR
ncbi:MAG TPA: TetR/AcrR family transcriptional regulator [Gammaproteobacteria bacterium]